MLFRLGNDRTHAGNGLGNKVLVQFYVSARDAGREFRAAHRNAGSFPFFYQENREALESRLARGHATRRAGSDNKRVAFLVWLVRRHNAGFEAPVPG